MTETQKPAFYADGRPDDTTILCFDKKPNGFMQFLGHNCTEADAFRRSENPQFLVVTPEQLEIIKASENPANSGQFLLTAAETDFLRETVVFKVETIDRIVVLNRKQYEAFNVHVAKQEAAAAEQH